MALVQCSPFFVPAGSRRSRRTPMTTSNHWTDCIRAFLHDPPDKSLSVKDHEGRTLANLAVALAIPEDQARHQAQKEADWLASACERLPLPKGTLWQDNKPLPDTQQRFNRIPADELQRCSSIDGSNPQPCATQHVRSQALKATDIIADIRKRHPNERAAAYALWRLLPEELPELCQLPGDTRLRDHSIIDHADAATAACAALRESQQADLLVFSLGPVQSFISQGRSLRDLWTGSYLLSWLTFQGMIPILEAIGPWAITSPGLRGNALCDWWLGQKEQGVVVDDNGSPLAPKNTSDLHYAGIPNSFTALVPREQAADLSQACQQAVQRAWRSMCLSVQSSLRKAWGEDGWDSQWQEQCDRVWDCRCLHVPFIQVNSSIGIIEETERLHSLYQRLVGEVPQAVVDAGHLAECLGSDAPGYVSAKGQGLWTMANELAQRVLEADKRARRVPSHEAMDDHREKCALMDGFSVMGPSGDTRTNHDWWKGADEKLRRLAKGDRPLARLRSSERLSAPGLVKRFAFDYFFRAVCGRMEFRDTRQAAMADWVHRLNKHEPKAWKQFEAKVARINDACEDDDIDPWTAYELLDPSRRDAGWWRGWSPTDHRNMLNELDQLLHKAKEHHLPEPRPYYAVLVADGDHMGKYLRGEEGPSFAQAYHPWMSDFLGSKGARDDLLQRVRPQGMAAQLAFSAALNRFTSGAAQHIQSHQGTCVYAGGDDVLAILPVATCLYAAAELARVFQREVGGTLTAGIAIVHSSDDLRSAISTARKAESYAKACGRDGLALTIARRSGDVTTAYCPWRFRGTEDSDNTRNLAHDWQEMARILAGQSPRWIHHLLNEQEVLRKMPLEAVWARARHLLLHGQEGELRKKAELDHGLAFPKLLDHFQEIWADSSIGMKSRDGFVQRAKTQNSEEAHAWLVDQFLVWCEHAAWLARFHDKSVREPATESAS
ncbi:MAG: type III-B CRISPR-associated protein Cas10/Cmr2 [Planctomycetota bacterium]|nr:MAG: type III-B CRISPR-associated protein Cas10/Cmr2 [Planctomycetota bacterium]